MLISKETFDAACAVLGNAETIAIDTETYLTKDWDRRRLIGCSTYCIVGGKAYSFYFPYRHGLPLSEKYHSANLPIDTLQLLGKTLNHRDVEHVFHNAKFDLNVFRLEGVELLRPFRCTMIRSHMFDENISHALEDLVVYFKIDSNQGFKKSIQNLQKEYKGWHNIPPDIMDIYATLDVERTYKLDKKLTSLLEKKELEHLWADEEAFCRVLADMEFVGVQVDVPKLQQLSNAATKRIRLIEQELGFDPAKPSQLANRLYHELGFRPSAYTGARSKQFPAGRPLMNEAELSKIKHPVVDLVLEHRGLVKARSTWYDGFTACADSSQRIHPNFKQHGTKTTRLSCTDPNLQQLPRDIEATPVYACLTAPSGYALYSFDYSQIELRLAAVYANEARMLEAFRSGTDVHQVTATQLGVSRHAGKTINFAILYGAGAGKLHELLGVSMDEARRILRGFHNNFPGFGLASQKAEAAAYERRYIKLWTGRRRNFEHEWEFHKSFNAAIQGGAAEIVKRGMLRLSSRIRTTGLRCNIVGQVHDCVWLYIHQSELPKAIDIVKECLEWPSSDPDFLINFPTEEKLLYDNRQ